MGRPLYILLVALVLFVLVQPTNATTYNLQVGARGDVESVGNMGVRAEILTHIYDVNGLETDDFWVGSILDNGAFIQFGYVTRQAGTYCSRGVVSLGTPFSCSERVIKLNASSALWFWAYWPIGTGSEYYFGAGSFAASNSSWHLYSIEPNSSSGWGFLLDGQQVANARFPSTMSRDRAFAVAEKVTSSTTPGPLGPVEFRDLAYLKEDGWHPVTALYALVNCGVNPNCIPIPYGVSSLGPNHIIAGTSVPQPKDGSLLWTNNESTQTGTSILTTSNVIVPLITPPSLFPVALLAATVAVVFTIKFTLERKRKRAKRDR